MRLIFFLKDSQSILESQKKDWLISEEEEKNLQMVRWLQNEEMYMLKIFTRICFVGEKTQMPTKWTKKENWYRTFLSIQKNQNLINSQKHIIP